MSTTIKPEVHRHQIEAYTGEFPRYDTFATALKRVLEEACKVSIPEAIVQARPKSVASFAEKCVRKFEKYPDAVNQLTDLCGARIIVQTLEQVVAVCAFVEQHFRIVERDNKSTALKSDQFGYRDLHYIIQVPPNCALGFSPVERGQIGDRRAELQVRTWVQHAWADTLHDRIYKTPLRLSPEIKRTGNLLAAVMEEGDRGFDRLASELDGMIANYAANAGKDAVLAEIGVQELLLQSAEPGNQPAIALKLARLKGVRCQWKTSAKSEGKKNSPPSEKPREEQWLEISRLLELHAAADGQLVHELRIELGVALCRAHRAQPTSAEYRRGQEWLRLVVAASAALQTPSVSNLRRLRSVRARAFARLGWSCESTDSGAHEARRSWSSAVELEPENPYYLAEMLGFELRFAQETTGILSGFRATIRAALRACEEHELAGTELPSAHFTAGRLRLLLNEPMPALHAYARGLRYCVTDGEPCAFDAVSAELTWLDRINYGRSKPEAHTWVQDLLTLRQDASEFPANTPVALPASALRNPVLIVAGGAAGLPLSDLPRLEDLLRDALGDFTGSVVSGGTTAGVPGCVGSVAETLRQANRKRFHLRGYIPHLLPHDAEKDKRYDELVASGADRFSPDQVLRGWKDVLTSGTCPTQVLFLGWGGGPIAAFEYRLALALGATVGVISGSGGAADALLSDPLWMTLPNLYPLPADAKTLRAFTLPEGSAHDPAVLEIMAKELHARYRADKAHKLKPDALRPWETLPDTYRTANLQQAAYAIRILEAAGFGVRSATDDPVIFDGFSPDDVELMAEMEHGRWTVERLRDHWRPGPRNDEKKTHDCLVAWRDLRDGPDGVKRFDRDSVGLFPQILAKARLEVFRKHAGN